MRAMGQISSTDCDRMRGYASASIDGELSEVEGAWFNAHLASCAACRAYAVDAAETARLLRASPLEELGFPIALPSRRLAVARRLQVSAAAAALAVTVGLSALVGSTGSTQASHSSTSSASGSAQSASLRFPEQELRLLQQASTARSRLVVHSRLVL